MSEQLELDVTEPQPEADNVVLWDWKTIGTQENFTVLGMSQDNKIYYWKDKGWNLL